MSQNLPTTPADQSADTSKKSKNWLATQLSWPVGLFGLALLVRLLYALQVPFPPLDDPAYYVQGARSLRQGTFFDMTITWNYAFKFDTIVRPGFDFWTPLAAFLIAGSFALFGDTPLAAQLPSILGGAALAVLTYFLARRAFATLGWSERSRRLIAGWTGLYVAINPLLSYQSITPDSMMIFGPLITAALLVYWGEQPSKSAAFWFGILTGLAYLARPHALFLAAAWFCLMLWRLYRDKPNRRRQLENSGLVLLGLTITVGPWALRNLFTFGGITSRTTTESILMYRLSSFYNYETPVNLQSFLALGLDKIIEVRLDALKNCWLDVLGIMFFPVSFLAAIGLLLLWRKNRQLGIALIYGFLTTLGMPIVLAVASLNGSLYHSIASLGGVAAIGLIYLLWSVGQWLKFGNARFPSLFPLLIGLFLAIELIQFAISAPAVIEGHRQEQAKYARLKSWLDANQAGPAVITDEPSNVNYATGLPTIRLPADESLEVVQRLARKFGVKYIVVTSNFGRYPALLLAPENQLFPHIYKDSLAGEFEIFLVP